MNEHEQYFFILLFPCRLQFNLWFLLWPDCRDVFHFFQMVVCDDPIKFFYKGLAKHLEYRGGIHINLSNHGKSSIFFFCSQVQKSYTGITNHHYVPNHPLSNALSWSSSKGKNSSSVIFVILTPSLRQKLFWMRENLRVCMCPKEVEMDHHSSRYLIATELRVF